MIQEKELRIGNYIGIGEDKVVRVVEIGSYTIRYLDNAYNDNFRAYLGYDYLKPIELTEEILLKCGFLKDEFDQWGNDTRLGFFQPEDFEGYLAIWGNSVIRHCEYLHQLQNLYFALTGTELEINI